MTTTTTSGQHQCEACTVKGLPILPLRYALAWAGDDVPDSQRAPRLKAPFDASGYPALGMDQAHYTLRLLRGGYLYVYDEARQEWSAYEVVPGGVLHAFDIHEGPSLGDKPAEAKCMRDAPAALARCIQVKDADRAGKLWLTHSDTQWTAAVKANHDDARYRAKHMRCIDVGAWYQGNGKRPQPHLSALQEVLSGVAEYALDAASMSYHNRDQADRDSKTVGVMHARPVNVKAEPAFMFSPYDFAALDRSDFRGVLTGDSPEVPLPDAPYAMVALDDPLGITAEVAALMNDRLEAFLTEPDRVRPMAASAAILQLRDAVEHQAVLKVVEASGPSKYAGNWDMRPVSVSGVEELKAQAVLDAKRLKEDRENAWASGGYLERYDESARLKWQETHDAQLAELNEGVIAPLAAAHVQLLESSKVQLSLQCNFDPDDVQSGYAYLGTILSCIVDTQDMASHAGLYARWVEGSPKERGNLLLRAYLLNQDSLADAVEKAAANSGEVSWKDLPWSYLFGLYDGALSSGSTGADALVATLLKQTVGPIAGLLNKAGESPVRLYGLLAWGMAGHIPLEKVVVKGKTRGAIVREVMLTMERVSGQRPRYQAVHAEVRRLQILGMNPTQPSPDIGFVGVRQDGSLVSGTHYRSDRNAFIGNKLGNWRSVIDGELRAGLAGSVLSAVALGVVYGKATGSMSHERVESWFRVVASGAAVIGSAMEMVGKKMERVGNVNPRFAKFAPLGELVRRIGGRVSAFGGFLMAGVDFCRAFVEFQRGNFKMVGFYSLSGIAGFGLTAAIWSTSLLWIGVFFLFVVFVMLAMMKWGDDLRHAWLDRCLWGWLGSERYPDESVEYEEYKLAVGSI